MKKFIFCISLGMAFHFAGAQEFSGPAGQIEKHLLSQAAIRPYNLEVAWDKTTVLIFPAGVKSADRGSRCILAQKDREISNILRLKAGVKGFPETNLSVITADGRLYHFSVNYSEDPAFQVIDMGKQVEAEDTILKFKNVSLTTGEVHRYCGVVSKKGSFLQKKAREGRVTLRLRGIYIKSEVMFFRFDLENSSQIDYNIDQWRFYVRDRRQVKRTAMRETELEPLHRYNTRGNGLPGKGENTVVVAFKKFTIADSKKLVVQLMEESGDRHLTLDIKGKHLLKARPVFRAGK
ncbi:conjugative transposon protein TraN [Galbibacter sp. EGI 63066]|uniref:conjugative transposon protein TraN n=1 Tax=Galbibacter sp. EGI 63066 TaxID=2993559 RepID=UPI002248E524|nr:conjugative transposon protein TraN [Galbibacter sp. EGI 63066]MCX2680995.1 conjugative transposon protein TraN [Galbibacter sp. EGI 63066]